MTFIYMKSFIYRHIHPCRWIKVTLNFNYKFKAPRLGFMLMNKPSVDRIYAQTIQVISNCHIITFVAKNHVVNSSIPQWLDIYTGKIVIGISNLPTFKLLAYVVVLISQKMPSHFFATTKSRPIVYICRPNQILCVNNGHLLIVCSKRLTSKYIFKVVHMFRVEEKLQFF